MEENLEAVKASGRVPASITNNKQFGWYYILRTDVTFNVQVNWGDYGTESNHTALEKRCLKRIPCMPPAAAAPVLCTRATH